MTRDFAVLVAKVLAGTFVPFDGDAGVLAYYSLMFHHYDLVWC